MARTCTTHTVMVVLVFVLTTETHISARVASANANDQTCDGQADILYILDASISVGADNFDEMKSFAADLTYNFPIGPSAFQFAVLRFESYSTNVFGFADYTAQLALAEAIKNVSYTRGFTDTASALQLARNVSFTAANGARSKATHIAIVVTDGASNNANETAKEAALLRDSGVSVIAIGVGSSLGYFRTELFAIASSPNLVFEVSDFRVLEAIKNTLAEKICEEEDKNDEEEDSEEEDCINNCEGRENGNYAACKPLCQQGFYYSCSNGYTYTMPCPLGWYVKSNNQRYTNKTVYNPESNSCEMKSDNCPREPQDSEIPQ